MSLFNKFRRVPLTQGIQKNNLQIFTCSDNLKISLCQNENIPNRLKNLIKFYLYKGSCTMFHSRGKRQVKIYEEDGIKKISFNDIQFNYNDIEFISNLTPFLSYKQLIILRDNINLIQNSNENIKKKEIFKILTDIILNQEIELVGKFTSTLQIPNNNKFNNWNVYTKNLMSEYNQYVFSQYFQYFYKRSEVYKIYDLTCNLDIDDNYQPTKNQIQNLYLAKREMNSFGHGGKKRKTIKK